ncbi:thioredoxin family protein [Streptacidiphilus cavernicola]|uniref:Thioredoxin family protein n=1 Tax=Streptacidiphilus cavernicola TaxID=3342716 RepID=A0ABV6VYF1_9ACTN
MTMTGRPGRVLRGVLAALSGLLLLSGCVVVGGRPVGGPAGGANRPGGVSGDSMGLARPFLPLPVVAPAAVPEGYDPSADAAADLAAALAAARADGRPVLLDFGSSWCEDCQALTTLVQSPGVHQLLARDYHLVTVDVGHYDRNTELAARYVTLPGDGIPALVVLAPDGSKRAAPGAQQFADARNLGADQVANLLVDWLFTKN